LPASQMADLFVKAKAAGVEAIKTNAFSLAPASQPIQTGPDQWDEKALVQLDQVTAQAQKAGLKLILSLSADDGPEGGKAAYAGWVGSPNPGVFYLNFQCKGWYEDYVKMLMGRMNSVTGVTYGAHPAILAWDLMDSPQNSQGDAGTVNQWIADMAAFVKTLSPHALVAVTLNPLAPGIAVDLAAGQPGVDFVLDRPTNTLSAMKWSQQIGKPVVALLDQPAAQPTDLGAGVLVSQPPGAGDDRWTALSSFFTSLSQEGGFGAKDFFASITAVPYQIPVLSWNAAEKIEVTLTQPARITVRYGLNGLLNQETPLSPEEGLLHPVTLSGLSAGTDYSYQVKSVGGTQTQYSNVSVFSTLKVAALTAPPPVRSNNFISVKGDRFYDGDKLFRFVGTNNYYLHFAKPESLEYVMSWA
ncbi:MAG TPA: hypothetical protein VN963_06000, partial [bacterium]|nr:hypothetical protein [bacterium]